MNTPFYIERGVHCDAQEQDTQYQYAMAFFSSIKNLNGYHCVFPELQHEIYLNTNIKKV